MGSNEIKKKLKIVLIEPRFSINLGLILRGMANFGFENLFLINPRCKLNSKKAKQFSMKGAELLKKIKIYNSLNELKKEDVFLIGTTRIPGRYRSKRYSTEEVRELIKIHPSPALVFGNEGRGLNRKEIRQMNALSTIDVSEGEKGSINLASAVTIYLYEIAKEKNSTEEFVDFKKINVFYKILIEELKKREILKENHYKHGEVILLDILKRAKIKEKEIGFLFYILKKLLNR